MRPQRGAVPIMPLQPNEKAPPVGAAWRALPASSASAACLQRYGCNAIHRWLKFFGSATPPFSRHGPKGRELLEDLVADSPLRDERALRAACNSIKARIELWNGTLSKLRDMRGVKATLET
jgi:hypothetical protein